VTIYGVHASGLSVAIDVEDGSLYGSLLRQATEAQSISSLTYLSDRTGGEVTARTNGYTAAFQRIAKELSSYYSIGYRTLSEKKGGERNLVVRARTRDLRVRTRRGFVDRTPEAEVRDRVVANLFFSSGVGGMRIAATAGTPQRVGGGVKVPVEVKIPVTALTFLPVEDQYAAGFSVFIAAADKREDTSAVTEQKQRISFPASELPNTPGAYYTYTFDVVGNAHARLSIAVVDELSRIAGYTSLAIQ
jgi:hypothetical protein